VTAAEAPRSPSAVADVLAPRDALPSDAAAPGVAAPVPSAHEPLAMPRIDFGGPAELPPPAARTGGDGPRLVVLYDRDCGICTATARTLRRWDRHGRLELLPLQDAAGSARPDLANAVRRLPLSAALHVVDERNGSIRSGGNAALAIAAALPRGRIVEVLGAIPPFRWSIGLGYRLIARHRRRIGRWLRLEGPVCELPR
jgi:predicted DCC family thiol-disulfide oxidoreductase YuxK